jgi:ABC-type branched-subunit amino acid transport system substrate-binding protein
MLKFITHYNWTRFAVIHSDDDYGRGLAKSIEEFRKETNLKLLTVIPFSLNCTEADAEDLMKKLKDADDPRIIVYLGFIEQLRVILKSARKHGLSGPGQVWLASEANAEVIIDVPDVQERMELFPGLLVFRPLIGSGQSFENFRKLWNDDEKRLNTGFEYAKNTRANSFSSYMTFYVSCLELMLKG